MYLLTGFLIGITSLIPGLSGGTILVILHNYNNIYACINDFKNNYQNIILILIGILIGSLLFSRILEILFYFMPNGTLIIFSSLIIFSLPKLIKKENFKINKLCFVLGLLLIYLLKGINCNYNFVVTDFPNINILFLILFTFYGAIDGFFTIIPGISGSMIMMILGPYFLYKSFLANLDFNHLIFAIPLFFYFLGDLIGIYIGSKFSLFILKKIPQYFMSTIYGMILASSFLIIPKLSLENYFKYLIFFIIGFILYECTFYCKRKR